MDSNNYYSFKYEHAKKDLVEWNTIQLETRNRIDRLYKRKLELNNEIVELDRKEQELNNEKLKIINQKLELNNEIIRVLNQIKEENKHVLDNYKMVNSLQENILKYQTLKDLDENEVKIEDSVTKPQLKTYIIHLWESFTYDDLEFCILTVRSKNEKAAYNAFLKALQENNDIWHRESYLEKLKTNIKEISGNEDVVTLDRY